MTKLISPFYPDTFYQFAWNSSALGVFKDCPRKYQLSYLMGWTPKGDSIHLRFGKLYHKGLEDYDVHMSKGDDAETSLDKVVDMLLQATWDHREYEDVPETDPRKGAPILNTGRPWDTSDHPAGSKKNRETLIRSVIWYIEHYSNDPVKTAILKDGTPAVELTFTMEIDLTTPAGEPYIFTGHMDRLVNYGDDLFVMDRKTSGNTLTTYFFDKFNPDNQMSLYTYAARVIYDVPVSGVIIDAAQIAVGFTTFNRGMTARSEGQLNEWMADTAFWLKAAERFADENYWPMNDGSCHKYDGCQFRRICGKDPVVREQFLKTDFIVDRENTDRILNG